MTIHFICKGNVLRSIIAEAYLTSLELPEIAVKSSGTTVDLESKSEQGYWLETIKLLEKHDIAAYAKERPEQLTQERLHNLDVTICMNQAVIDDAVTKVTLPPSVITWDVTDVNEGSRIVTEENRAAIKEEIYKEVTGQVDELVATFNN